MNWNIANSWNLSLRAYDGNTISGADADFVWTASLRKAVAENVWANLTYGRRDLEVTTPSGADKFEVLRAGVEFAL